MAVTLFYEKNDEHTNVYIFTDNPSAIEAVNSPKRQSGFRTISHQGDIRCARQNPRS
jgi:hypothetical protein